MKVSICIGSVRATTLGPAIESIQQQTWDDWELIVVGQGPDPALRSVGESAAARDSRVRYIHLDQKGVSLARNVAVRASVGEIIAITDDDCEARADWIATLVESFAAEPDVDVVGGALIAPTSRRPGFANCPDQVPSEALYDPVASGMKPPAGWDWVTANVAFRRHALERAGPFDECFGPGAVFRVATDTDYKFRLELLGVRMRSTPRAVVFHTHGCRYGLGPVVRRSIDYSFGHGALAAKLTLLGEQRGREWLEIMRRECTVGWLRPFRPDRLAVSLVQLAYFTRGYTRCLREYRLDATRGVLQSLAASTTA
jgi:glycosyltransferase involved in cell wall biosynthesis